MTDQRRSAPLTEIILTTMAAAKSPAAQIKTAEAKAKAARLAKDPTAKPYQFAVNYRLDKTAKSAKGDYTARYNALIERVRGLDGTPWHYATSAWEIHSHQGSAAVLAALSAPLDAKIDLVTVTPIGATKVFGDPKKLES